MSRGYSAPYVMVEFSCHHKRSFERKRIPPRGEVMYCLTCRQEVVVVGTIDEYRIRCNDCTYSRPYGANKLQAEIQGSKHHNRYPYHEVILIHGTQEIHKWPKNEQHLFAKSLQGKRVSDLDLPPF